MNPNSFKAPDRAQDPSDDGGNIDSVMSSIASDAYKFEAQLQMNSSNADVARLISSGVLSNLEIVNAARADTGKLRNANSRS